MLTAVPWAGFTLVGTFQSDRAVAPEDDSFPSSAAMDTMLDDLSGAFPALGSGRSDIRLAHHGLTPAVVKNGRTELMPDAQLLTHDRDGAAGLYSLIGVKFTTARQAAGIAIDAITAALGREPQPSTTGTKLLPDGSDEGAAAEVRRTIADRALSIPLLIAEHLVDWYGTEAAQVLGFCADRHLTHVIGTQAPILAGELAYAVTAGRAIRLSDAVLRRTRLGGTGHPGTEALAAAAAIVAGEWGWPPETVAAEIADVERRYPS
jgi:glycerol-3-phosphate dehydrogenase